MNLDQDQMNKYDLPEWFAACRRYHQGDIFFMDMISIIAEMC